MHNYPLYLSALLVMAQPVLADPLRVCGNDGRCGQARPLELGEMAGLTGKFAVAGEVVGMNLLMTSSWQGQNGQQLQGRAGVSIGLPGSASPHAYYSAEASATEVQAPGTIGGTGNVLGGEGLRNLDGASQVIQVAGDGNVASNVAAVDVVRTPLAPSLPAGDVRSASAVAANGATAAVDITNSHVSVQLRIPDLGSVQQQVGGNIHQGIQLAADRQVTSNQMQLQLQVQAQSAAALASQGVESSLNMLRGR